MVDVGNGLHLNAFSSEKYLTHRTTQLFPLGILILLIATPARGESVRYGQLSVLTTPHKVGEPCSGGNIEGLVGLQKLPNGTILSKGLNLQKIEPGRYLVYYQQSEFRGSVDQCSETFPPLPQDNDWGRVPSVEINVAASKVYQLSLDREARPHVEVLDKLPVTELMIGGIYTLAQSLPLWTNICANLFPETESDHRRRLNSSSVRTYARLFGLPEFRASQQSTARRLEEVGQSAQQAMVWCSLELPNAVDAFDYSYADRVEEVRDFLNQRDNTGSRESAR